MTNRIELFIDGVSLNAPAAVSLNEPAPAVSPPEGSDSVTFRLQMVACPSWWAEFRRVAGPDNAGKPRQRRKRLKMEQLHDQAMDLAWQADRMKWFFPRAARLLFARAYRLERHAASMGLFEPSRGILWRSAAWLAFSAGMPRQARRAAMRGIIGAQHAWVTADLSEVLAAIEGQEARS